MTDTRISNELMAELLSLFEAAFNKHPDDIWEAGIRAVAPRLIEAAERAAMLEGDIRTNEQIVSAAIDGDQQYGHLIAPNVVAALAAAGRLR